MFSKFVRGAFVAAAVCLCGSMAQAATVAVSLADQAPNIVDGNVRNVGWQFTTNTALNVTSLGVYDPASYSSPITVGLFTTAGSLLVSAVVPANSNATGQFQYVSLASPFALASGQAYIINAFIGSEHWLAPERASVSVNPAITIASVSSSWFTCCENVGFQFPGGSNTGATYHGNSVGDTRLFLGPNFEFTISGAVPEPSTWALLTLGFVGMGIMLHRRRRATCAA